MMLSIGCIVTNLGGVNTIQFEGIDDNRLVKYAYILSTEGLIKVLCLIYA